MYHEAIREDLRQAAMNAFLAPVGREGEALAHISKFTSRARVEDVVDEALADSAKDADAAARRARQQRPRAGQAREDDDDDEEERPASTPATPDGPPRLVLVATDRMSRGASPGESSFPARTSAPAAVVLSLANPPLPARAGIDCMNCNHVVLFDFPRDPSEYVRRVGRTARGAGGTGVVSSLVLGRQVALAREIMGRNEKGQPVHRLPRL